MMWLWACYDGSAVFLSEPLPKPGSVEHETTETSALVINEVQAYNDSTYQQLDGSLPTWIELYNGGEEVVDLGTVRLSGRDFRWEGEGMLEAGGVWMVEGMALGGEGDRLVLTTLEGTEYLAFGQLPADTSWARYADGFAMTVVPTPGRVNGNFPVGGEDAGAAIFQDQWFTSVDLFLPPDSMAALEVNPYQEVLGSVGTGGVFFPEVGIHLKGGYGSLRTLSEKAGFKVDLNAYQEHRIAGQETLTLNNMVQDPIFLHEYLTYSLFRSLGVPAPRTGWTRVRVNGEFFGLYLWVETVDDTFLDRWWDSKDGTLYEGAYGVDLVPGSEFSFEYDEGPNPNDRRDLTELIALLDVVPSEAALYALEERLDVDQVLLVLAVEAGTLHWDGYTTQNNYRLYHDPVTDRFSMIPWGTDQTWVDWWYGPYDGRGHFLQWCLQVESCAARYDEKLLLVADQLEVLPLSSMLEAAYVWIEPEILVEPRYEHGDVSRQSFLDRTRETLLVMPDYLRGQVEGRE